MKKPVAVLSLSFALISSVCGAQEALRELGQPDFRGFMPNRLDGRGISQPWGVAVDTSRNPNGLWVLDARNNRVLGWRDVTALRNGMRADVVIGQPDRSSNGCNNGGRSAASLCVVQSPFDFSYQPGLAVDAAGNLYVADQANYRILGFRRPFDTDGVADLVIGQARFDQLVLPWEQQPSDTRIYEPHGMATDAQGNLYIGDIVRVLELDRPFETDALADRVFGQTRLDAFDQFTDGTAADRIPRPLGVAVDAEGRLYVTDAWSDRLMVWTQPLARQGAADLVFHQGASTCGNFGCNNIKAIAIEADGDLWVSSHHQGRIYGYRSPFHGGDTEPDHVIVAASSAAVFNPTVPGDGRPMFASGGLAIDSTGTLWLTDENRVLGFFDPWNDDGRADRLLGQVRLDQVEANLVDRDGFELPDAIALDTSTAPPHLYVVDTFNHRVLGWADAEGFSDGQPADLILGQPDRWASGCNTGGRSLATLCLGGGFNGLAVDARGTVWVSDPGNARVLGFRSPFTTDAVADFVLGGVCTRGWRGLCIPGGLALDKAGNLFVADIGNNRILEFNEPSRRDTFADRELGVRQGGERDGATFFSEENNTHPGLNIYGGLLTMDADGRLLVGNGGAVYVFEKPLQPRASSRKLIDLTAAEGFFPPRGLATDSASRIYLSTGARLYRFSRTGAGSALDLGEHCPALPEGLGRATLCSPTGLAVGPSGELFVSDAALNRVVVFDNP